MDLLWGVRSLILNCPMIWYVCSDPDTIVDFSVQSSVVDGESLTYEQQIAATFEWELPAVGDKVAHSRHG